MHPALTPLPSRQGGTRFTYAGGMGVRVRFTQQLRIGYNFIYTIYISKHNTYMFIVWSCLASTLQSTC